MRGKTALIETFTEQARSESNVSILIGHCFEHFGASEPYMPVWEALGQLAREKPSGELTALLARHAQAYVPQAMVAGAHESQAVAVEGRYGQPIMSSFAGQLSEEELLDLILYIKSLGSPAL